jgi:hypothetical protein
MKTLSSKVIARIKDLYEDNTWEEITNIINKEFKIKKSAEAIRKAFKRREANYGNKPNGNFAKKPKILVFDIETAPMEVLTWGIWDQNVPLSRIRKDWSVLAWAAKWLGDDPESTVYEDTFKQKDMRDDRKVLKNIWKMLDEADYVLGHNSDAFDIKKLNARFIQHGMQPPSSYKRFDTKKLAKRHFAFTSNKLEYITDKLCTKYKKLKHSKFPGNALWDEFLKGNSEAQKEMEIYNKYDVLSLEEAFLKILPWESANLFEHYYESEIDICTCGSIDFKKNGFAYTQASKFQRYTCKNCGAEMKDKKSIQGTRKRTTKR